MSLHDRRVVAVSSLCYQAHGLQEALAGIAQAGFRFVELAALRGVCEHVSLDTDDSALLALEARLKHHRLEACSLSAHSDLTTREGLELGHKAIRLASCLGIPFVITSIGGAASTHADRQDDERVVFANLRELADRAASDDVVIALEVHGGITADGERCLATVRRIGHPAVKINYDTANTVYYAGTWPYQDLARALPEVAHVHLKDKVGGAGIWDFPPLGEGEIDFRRVLGILDEQGYRGPLSVEIGPVRDRTQSLEEIDRAVRISYDTLSRLLNAL